MSTSVLLAGVDDIPRPLVPRWAELDGCRCARTAGIFRPGLTRPARWRAFCVLDLAPEAPWRCPANCPSYEKGIIDSTFVVGSLVRPQVEAEPDVPEGDVAGVLDEADFIVTAGEGEIVKEIEREPGVRPWRKVWRRKEDGGPNLGERAARSADGEVCGNPATPPLRSAGGRFLSTAPGSDWAKTAGPGQDTRRPEGGNGEPGCTTSAARPMGGVI